ncbi:MAG: hypothetical protein CVU46_10230 [Chloroflexi bacterium HGW-Chloroflexi-8]|nr:MAG: hypothetical protein CVU46_10230 [Chloroflexi bacterium HGW-Chloroflexi-8]
MNTSFLIDNQQLVLIIAQTNIILVENRFMSIIYDGFLKHNDQTKSYRNMFIDIFKFLLIQYSNGNRFRIKKVSILWKRIASGSYFLLLLQTGVGDTTGTTGDRRKNYQNSMVVVGPGGCGDRNIDYLDLLKRSSHLYYKNTEKLLI